MTLTQSSEALTRLGIIDPESTFALNYEESVDVARAKPHKESSLELEEVKKYVKDSDESGDNGSSVGRSMWEYGSDFHCVKDILKVGLDEIYGMLGDVELGLFRGETVQTAVIPDELVKETKADVNRDALMTGIPQFMAHALLLNRPATRPEVKHDLESFVWSFAYCIWQDLTQKIASRENDPTIEREKPEFFRLYAQSFTEIEPKKTALSRTGHSPLLQFVEDPDLENIVASFMSQNLVELFVELGEMVHLSQPTHIRFSGSPMTHDVLLGAVEKAIDSRDQRSM